MSSKIEDYALIGDCKSAALVGRDGSIDWLCWPRFDSEACFAALLGSPKHGRWLIAPHEEARITRNYRSDTLILETHFETKDGAATLVDFMPFRDDYSEIVRLVVGKRGKLKMRMELILRFGYGAVVPWVTRMENGALRAIAGPDMAVLRTPIHVKGEGLTTIGDFTIAQGETIPLTLTYSRSHKPLPNALDPNAALETTEKFWREWSAKCRPAGEWSDAVKRSIMTLKALTYKPTGGIVAAPTTSLPEHIGGERNWDYRYCWLRDATLTLLGAMHAGYYEEAQAWREWLLRAVAGSPNQLQIMYGIGGERRLAEWEVEWLPGYENSRPVRIGNAAHVQSQLDVFGEIMDVHHQARRNGLSTNESGWDAQVKYLEHLAEIWRSPDQGIWEIRGPAQNFTYSKVMVWVAFDRAIKSAETFGLEGPIDEWSRLRDDVFEEVCAYGFDKKRGCFVQAYGSDQLDANLLLLPCVGFLPVSDPRIAATITAIERELLRGGFVSRYSTENVEDALPPGEGVFLACSFWLVDVYILQERYDEAEQLFRRLVGLSNDLGLLSEEYDPREKRLVGNFPQAFSHLALINSAYNLTDARKPLHQRAHDDDTPTKPVAARAEAEAS
ncbi:MAG TPA: glycoside hydrolase family 15 protein [Xanthobacteraceae bacterium]|jgi:GH15 family glucan-1,4-alpha-glucosidase|nr:glycoside hydrolase family 15 protein [Xanthobacteraceae bacterium]